MTVLTPMFQAPHESGPRERVRKPAPVLTAELLSQLVEEGDDSCARAWTITPEIAMLILDRHDQAVRRRGMQPVERTGDNRPYRNAEAQKYGRDMEDSWARNGETVKITSEWIVVDGQHRLGGCAASGVAFETLVFFGSQIDHQDTIDRGISRTLGDSLALKGELNGNSLAAIARWAWRFQRGNVMNSNGSGMLKPSDTELLEWIRTDERLRLATSWATVAYGSFRKIRVSVYGMAWMICHGIDYAAAEVFMDCIKTGANMPETHPAMVLRARMMNGTKENGKRLRACEELALIIYAWNAWREGRPLTKLQLPKGGLKATNFPKAI